MNLINKLINYKKVWGSKDVVFFTANQVVKRNGALVMGAGNAKAARDSVKGADMAFGKKLGTKRVCTIKFKNIHLGAFVTKTHFKGKSNINFVRLSIKVLYELATINPDWTFHLPYPAIGYGGLTREQLDPSMKCLPSNVLIYINPKKF